MQTQRKDNHRACQVYKSSMNISLAIPLGVISLLNSAQPCRIYSCIGIRHTNVIYAVQLQTVTGWFLRSFTMSEVYLLLRAIL